MALDELLDASLDEDSLHVGEVLAFCVVRAKDYHFLNPHLIEVPTHDPLRFQSVLQWTWSLGSL